MKEISKLQLIIKILKSKTKKTSKYNSICLNTETNKIEIEGMKLPEYIYSEILDICDDKYKDIKFTKNDIKNAIEKYALENKYTPEKKQPRNDKSDWYGKLEFDKDDKPKKTLNNIILFFENYPLLKDKLYYNDFTQYEEYADDLIRDHHISEFRSLCENELNYESKDKVECAVQCITHRNSFNPFQDRLNEILWDGVERAETFFIDFVGVHDTKLNRSMTKKWLYAMIKRLYEPGCPFDNMLIIYDAKQGTGKSKIVERLVYSLGVNYGYNTSITCDNKDKDNVDKLNKSWVVGIDEMNEFLKKNPEQTKQFLAQSTDQARLSYARRSEIYKRHCVFYGNSNLEYFLKDYTSNFERRYWIMEANGEVHDNKWWNEHLTDEYCQQVLAEMKYFFTNNPDFNYATLDLEETKELEEVQFRHKTLNNDELLRHKITEILNKTYKKPLFSTYEMFKKAAENAIENDNFSSSLEPPTKEFFGMVDVENEEEEEKPSVIKKIPVSWVKMYVEEVLHRNVSTQYITALLRDNYEYKKCKYNGVTTNCYSIKLHKNDKITEKI